MMHVNIRADVPAAQVAMTKRGPPRAVAGLRRAMSMFDSKASLAECSVADEAAALALRRRMPVERRRALVVDDSHSVRKTLAQLLGDAGDAVRTARDGFDAPEQLSRETADIVLTDLEIPNLNGLDLTRRLRKNADWQALPVIMISSRGTDKHRSGAAQACVSAYLTKPYTDAELLGQVKDLLTA